MVGHPFDTVKVKLQSGASVMNGGAAGLRLGALGVARQTVLSEGVSGLFKGMGAPLATVSALNAVLFAANGALRGFARKITGVQVRSDRRRLKVELQRAKRCFSCESRGGYGHVFFSRREGRSAFKRMLYVEEVQVFS